ncbi:hypothetical protein BH11ARM2_BH11ARM2_21550 [soil metagenome]
MIKQALKEQIHASLAMLAQCVERCPDDLWVSGTHPRAYWRIAFHAVFYAQLYLGQNEAAFQPWLGHREDIGRLLNGTGEIEPFDLPEETVPYRQKEMLGYLAFVDSLVDPTVDGLDLEAVDTGFSWYKNMRKLSHELLSLRHIQGHVGQLSELLMEQGIDIDWISRRG